MLHLRKKILAWLENRKRYLENIQENNLMKYMNQEQNKRLIKKIQEEYPLKDDKSRLP